MSIEKWIEFWSKHDRSGYHANDVETIQQWRREKDREVNGPSIPHFPLEQKDRGKLHPKLTPVPYVGDLRNATIILAMLNPTVGEQDYVDDQTQEFHELLERNRQQKNVQDCFAVDDLSNAPSWSCYYRSIFKAAVHCASDQSGKPKEQVWQALKRSLAIIELVPYYSQNASILLQNDRYLDLPSARCALDAMEHLKRTPKMTVVCRWKRGPERWRIKIPNMSAQQRGGDSARRRRRPSAKRFASNSPD